MASEHVPPLELRQILLHDRREREPFQLVFGWQKPITISSGFCLAEANHHFKWCLPGRSQAPFQVVFAWQTQPFLAFSCHFKSKSSFSMYVSTSFFALSKVSLCFSANFSI
jgi:hypothetical protein